MYKILQTKSNYVLYRRNTLYLSFKEPAIIYQEVQHRIRIRWNIECNILMKNVLLVYILNF